MNDSYIFQIDSDIVRNQYETNDNYLIVFDELCNDKTICAIYFSSNDIYYPNEEAVFRKRILEKNTFEWFHTRIRKAYKHIFVRDIHKQWYLSGINDKINSQDTLFSFLKKETDGYKVIALGSSAGGYAAVLFGLLLKADKVLAFNAQFEIKSLLVRSNGFVNPLVFKFQNTSNSRYYDLKPYIETDTNTNIFYFFSMKSKNDILQYHHIMNIEKINFIGFHTKHHGIPFLKAALLDVIDLTENQLRGMAKHIHFPFMFSVHRIGLRKTIVGLLSQIRRKSKRRKAK